MRFKYVVEVEIEREQGKFASRDEMSDQIKEALEGADYGSWEGENGGQYNTVDFSVDEEIK